MSAQLTKKKRSHSKKLITVLAIVAVLAVSFVIASFASRSSDALAEKLYAKDSTLDPRGPIKVGTQLTINEAPDHFTLHDNNDTLAAEGLYYASWTDGKFTKYKNDEGETVDLYDAQLYLLTTETKSAADAKKSMDSWYGTAKEKYQVKKTNEVTVNGQDYTVIAYTCGESSPYERGVSAFGANDAGAVCFELTCTDGYEKKDDLTAIMTDFLGACQYA